MISVTWVKLTTGGWPSLARVDLQGRTDAGVYIIWHAGQPSRVVRVGQGDPIAARLICHRTDKDVQAYAKFGTLHVTWASVPAGQRNGVERYLAEQWKPLVGDRWPDVPALAVSSPWAA